MIELLIPTVHPVSPEAVAAWETRVHRLAETEVTDPQYQQNPQG
jgi:hypothetical protein